MLLSVSTSPMGVRISDREAIRLIKEAGFETGIRHCAATTTFLKSTRLCLRLIRVC
mgnify:CR=1 FL=1